jgi:hypothetical protein
MGLNATTNVAASDVRYTVTLDNIFYGGLSLTREPLTLDLNERFDLLRLRYGYGSVIDVDDENRMLFLGSLVFGANEGSNGKKTVNIEFYAKEDGFSQTECFTAQGEYDFFDVLYKASMIFRDHLINSNK